MPDWLIGLIERAVDEGKDASSLKELVVLSNSRLELRQELSFGAVYLVHESSKAGGIPKALGPSEDAKLALWQVLARTLLPATALLDIVRLAGTSSAPSLLGIQSPFNEDDPGGSPQKHPPAEQHHARGGPGYDPRAAAKGGQGGRISLY